MLLMNIYKLVNIVVVIVWTIYQMYIGFMLGGVLRKSSPTDILSIYEKHENYHGFPRMLGSINCMH
jgi:hypothetical protein